MKNLQICLKLWRLTICKTNKTAKNVSEIIFIYIQTNREKMYIIPKFDELGKIIFTEGLCKCYTLKVEKGSVF